MYNMKTVHRIRALQEDQTDSLENQGREEVRREALLWQRKFEEWKEALANTRKSLRAVGAIHPVLKKWVDRRHRALGFRLVQVLTGHGCFGEYLHRIGKEPTMACHHCDAPLDTAEHTLAVCPAWEENRRVLRDVTAGGVISLPTIVQAMVGGEDAWGAAPFCEYVMSQKEVAEREREVDARAPPPRRKRGGVAGRAYARLDLTPP
jgi:hypothetical protein